MFTLYAIGPQPRNNIILKCSRCLMCGQSTGLILKVVAINLFRNCSMNMHTIVDVHIVGTQMPVTGAIHNKYNPCTQMFDKYAVGSQILFHTVGASMR